MNALVNEMEIRYTLSAMKCTRCRGIMFQDRIFDLPGKIDEYFCLNCGARFWIRRFGLVELFSLN
jgi:DNA-directed RNA polymerase subunit RPC12/RpoP